MAAAADLRRRITYLMLFRVVLITLVLSLTVVLNLASPQDLARPSSVVLFAIVAVTYLLTLVYAVWLTRTRDPGRLADAQLAGDLIVTAAIVHVTGGAQSAYTFFFPLSIIGAATLRFRRGALVVAVASVVVFVGVSLLGWFAVLPVPTGLRVPPWDLPGVDLARSLLLNVGAMSAVGVLAANLGSQLARAGAEIETQKAETMDLAALNDGIVRGLSSGLVTVDRAGRVISFNEAAAEITGARAAHAAGRPLVEIVPALGELLSQTAERRSVRRAEIEADKGGQRLVLGVSISPLTGHRGDPQGRILNFQDLTELRRMEAQVTRTQRLAALGGMAAGIAHEIRNPLASISGSIELLRKAPGADRDGQALMDIVLREVDRLNGMVSELLDYARPRDRVLARVELAPLVEETVQVFAQDRSAPGVSVRLDLAAGARELAVDGDAAQLRQVVWNLLRNAADAMPGGGEIVIGVARDGAEAVLSIADQGGGIAPEDRERIFEPFYTTKTHGTGLGLPIVHRIVSEHGGAIEVDSTPGRGARFVVRLPTPAAPATPAASPRPRA